MTKQPPSRRWHLVSVILFILGAMVTPISVVFLLAGQMSSGEAFAVPGTYLINIEKPGTYGIWNIVSEFRDGIQRDYSDKLPTGTRIIVLTSTGKEIPTQSDMNCTERSGDSSRKSICNFVAKETGTYSIVVDGMSEKQSFMIRRSMASHAVVLFVLGGLVSILGWIIPIFISVLVEIKRHKFKQELANPRLQRTEQPAEP